MGHALNNTLQDILVRWKRMDGFNTLWMPGTDHAGIATQNVVERQLSQEGTSKEALGRDAFVQRIWRWREESGGTIIRQLKRLGASCDWARERFTMDPGLSRAVREVFVRLWEEKLIYQGEYIVNWCPRCRTALSDLEVEHQESDGVLYHIRYPFIDGQGAVTVATTRPESMLGDTAVAVHPNDKRYQAIVGKTVRLPLVGRELPIIADAYVDPKFGTGALKVTPAHDANDYVLGQRHKLAVVKVMDDSGRMSEAAGPAYAGLDRFACRERIVSDLRAQGLLVKEEPYRIALGSCYRCKSVVEPLLSRQWFLRMAPLAAPAIKAVRERKIKIVPRSWTKTYFAWMENIRDWCISRQIWWGHRIPVWYCDADGSIHVSRTDLERCPRCQGPLRQETDVLDTWFSSALWPFSTLGWPDETPELRTFYPTSCLVTGFDILFFWVARMIMMGLKFMGDAPFRDVYIHALVRDAEGQKMSKSKGNVIDPLSVMDQYGTDAFRFTLTALAAQGRDIRLAEERIEGYRNFANKLWNASRFVLTNFENHDATLAKKATPTLPDRWIQSRLARTTGTVRRALTAYRFNDAANAVYQFLWHEFCDWYLECSKLTLYRSSDPQAKALTQKTLVEVLEVTLRLLHPFMPFITEELWQRLPHKGESIMLAPYPRSKHKQLDPEAERAMELLMAVVSAIRNIRAEMRIAPAQPVTVIIKPSASLTRELTSQIALIEALAKAEVSCDPTAQRPPQSAMALVGEVELYLPLAGIVDLETERQRVEKEIRKLTEEIQFVESKLARPEFREKAPREVVEREEQRSHDAKAALAKLEASLRQLT
jgi:valyl-tRNA synthetase